jgi:hypothetical protein
MSESTQLPGEEWRPYPGSPFEVSNLGRVRSWAWKRCRLLKPQPNTVGYLQVGWRTGGGSSGEPRRRHMRLVSHMVLECFVGPCPPGFWALHGDDHRTNNRLDNLRWGTPLENRQDAIRNGRVKSKLTAADVELIKGLLVIGRTQPHKHRYWNMRRIAERFGVSQPTIAYIASGKVHRDVPGPEAMPTTQWIS